jgi:hypothetical protein
LAELTYKYQLTGHGFESFTGLIGKTSWVNGMTESIPDQMDKDLIRVTLGMEVVEIPPTDPLDPPLAPEPTDPPTDGNGDGNGDGGDGGEQPPTDGGDGNGDGGEQPPTDGNGDGGEQPPTDGNGDGEGAEPTEPPKETTEE